MTVINPSVAAAAQTTAANDTIYDAKGDLVVGTGPDAAVRKAVGADGTSLRANSAAAGGVEWLLTAEFPLSHTNIVVPVGVPLPFPSGGATMTANRIYLSRFIMPRAGTLAGIAIWVTVSSGNYDVGVYDTNDALAGSRSRLYEKGSTAMPAAGWQEVGTPALAVTRGQQIDIAVQVDNATAQIGRQILSTAGGAFMPSGYGTSAGGALFKGLATGGTPGALGLPSTIAEATCIDVSNVAVPSPMLRLT